VIEREDAVIEKKAISSWRFAAYIESGPDDEHRVHVLLFKNQIQPCPIRGAIAILF
jgi:hypothetical protein